LILVAILAATAAPAHAGGPTRITLTGVTLSQPVVVGNVTDSQLFMRLHQLVFAAGLEIEALPAPNATTPARTGPRFTMVVDYHDVPTYRYELYPYTSDGPRIHLPADQPRQGMQAPGTPGWYRSTATMLVVLSDAGALATASAAPAVAIVPAAPSPVVPIAVGALLALLSLAGWRWLRTPRRSPAEPARPDATTARR
jgi:hypothetical protein